MTDRIGIMGGMFDPVHLGHTGAALAAAEALDLDGVLMVPCARPNHREGASAPADDRLAMLELACRSTAALRVDDRELRRPGTSFMADTLQEIASQFPDALRVFIQGWDSFLTLPRWERWRDVLRFSHICAVSRPGCRLPDAGSEDGAERLMADLLAARRVRTPQALAESEAGGILVLDVPDCDISSTRLRSLLYRARQGDAAARRQADQWLSPSVAAYIHAHRLY